MALDPGEDFNHNGRLDPGNVATVPVSVTTGAQEPGFAFFDVEYARDRTWVEVALEARTVVAGSEGSAQAIFFLPGVASDFSNCLVTPPGAISPYGIATTCACDERTDPATCPVFVSAGPVTILTTDTILPNTGGTFTFTVSGGSETSYSLVASAGTLSTLSVIFGNPFTLTLPPNNATAPLTITISARDVVTGQVGTLNLTQVGM